MMFGWSFPAKTFDEVSRLLRALGRHRYVRDVDHRLHFTVDEALADRPGFAERHAAFRERLRREPSLDPDSREPTLWREASLDEVLLALGVLWSEGDDGARARERLAKAVAATGLPPAAHEPFACPPDDPPHPELVFLAWELLPVGELDPERHAGALASMEDSGDEAHPSEPVNQEGPILALPELTVVPEDGELFEEFFVWSDGPYAYADYVFRGAAKAAKLGEPPLGHRDF